VEWQPYYYLDYSIKYQRELLGQVLVDFGAARQRLWRLIQHRGFDDALKTRGLCDLVAESRFVVGVSTGNRKTFEAIGSQLKQLKQGLVRRHYSPELAAITSQAKLQKTPA
jgi:hypothetical protein